ncbi:MAG: hypothetical protein FJY80_02485 [Candidatus Aminicenantes bacterium]|nr:hypothetical protein [Candidatus Aminicenantes bacterium]
MSRKARYLAVGALVLLAAGCARKGSAPTVYVIRGASAYERLAAAELRRYLYLTTGELVAIREVYSLSQIRAGGLILDSQARLFLDDAPAKSGFEPVSPEVARGLGFEGYWLKTIRQGSRRHLLIAGGSGLGTLYGTYAFIEKLGVRFYLEGDVVPEERAAFVFPDLDEKARPLFARRGIQPFHDFAEGPDWWDEETYKTILMQLPKLRMNVFGLHTYPEKNPNAEPTVWIGLPGEFDAAGNVSASYPSSYQNTRRANPWSHNWGYRPKPTSSFHFGADRLFERDDFGPEVMFGLMPEPASPDESNLLFNRTAAMLRRAFTLARRFGVLTCAGMETPLTVPALVQERLRKAGRDPKEPAVIKELYKGVFQRILAAYPLDVYWFWTTESWTWSDAGEAEIKAVTDDLLTAVAAAREVQAPFSLATCGWVLGPPSNRSLFDQVLPKEVAATCINREVGKAPVDPSFGRIAGPPSDPSLAAAEKLRSKWAIPWLEDDPSLTSPQLWAGRMRRDAVDALTYGCDGLLGIHWRTRILSPNVLALARAAWDQSWDPSPTKFADLEGPVSGWYVALPEKAAVEAKAEGVYRDVRDRAYGYHLRVPDGTYRLTLQFVEHEFDRKNARVFDVFVQEKKAAEKVDLFARAGGRFKAWDAVFPNISVQDGRLNVDFGDRIHYPSIAGLVVEGKTVQGLSYSKKINCGGGAAPGYDPDWPETSRHLPALDLYRDWARNQFGPDAAEEAAAILARLDGKLPNPVNWTDGPGGIAPSPKPWEDVRKAYAFVDEWAALKSKVKGAGFAERFDYWLANFEYMRETARYQCLWADYNTALDEVKKLGSDADKAGAAREKLLPARARMAESLKALMGYLLATVSNTGELGTIANWEQHLVPPSFEKPGEELVKLLGGEIPAEAELSKEYGGPSRFVVPTVRTSLEEGEPLRLKAMILSRETPAEPTLFWREMGTGAFRAVLLEPVARGVYKAEVAAPRADFEYYLTARADGRQIVFPATAPEINQTVIVIRRD